MRRASSGRTAPDEVLRSTVTRSEKKAQSLRARLSGMRSGMGWVHSNRCPGSKWAHCLHEWSSALQPGHWPSGSLIGGRSVPQSAQRETLRLPVVAGGGETGGSSRFADGLLPDSL